MTTVESRRKVGRGELAPGCPAHAGTDEVWHLQDHATAREFLRHADTRQAGFGIEGVKRFAKDLSALSFQLAVAVAGEVVGLTDGRGSMARRLDRFFALVPDGDATGFAALRQGVHQLYTMGAFYWRDVRPAVAVRRKRRRDDLISHLIDEGCNAREILGECVTVAAAGMVTTREFISVAAWHLFTDDDLRARYLAGDEKERFAVGEGMSFGDGAHRCPGSYLAIQESDIFLTKLFALPGLRMVREPEVRIRPEIAAYELVGLVVEVSR